MSAGEELSKIDQTILRYCDSESPEEISRRLGGTLTPEWIASRVKKLLADANWLTQVEQEELILRKMRRLVAELEQVSDKDLNTRKVQLDALEKVAKRLDKRREATAIDLNAVYESQAVLMLRALDLATGYLRGAFRKQIDQEKWDEAIKEGMALAAAEIDKHKAIDQ